MEPLAAVVTRLAFDVMPALLEAYLDLELEADLLGGEPDSHYRRRLVNDLSLDQLVEDCRAPSRLLSRLDHLQQISDLQASQLHDLSAEKAALLKELSESRQQTTEAREEAELILLQLHQVQEELEHHFLLSREQAKLLEEGQHKHQMVIQGLEDEKTAIAQSAEALKQQFEEEMSSIKNALNALEAEKSALQQQLSESRQQTTEAREEAELTLLQLHQVQEELEHYFLLSRGQSKQLDHYDSLLLRSEGLLSLAAH